MPPHMCESTTQALSDLQDVFQQAAIKYNADPATHVIQAAPPRVPPDAHPEPASPTTPPSLGTIEPSPQPSPLLSTRTVSDPRVHDGPMLPVVLTQLDFLEDSLSLQCVSPRKSSQPNPPKVQAPSSPLKQHTNHSKQLPFGTPSTMMHLRATHEAPHRHGLSLRRPS
jgi:hypothetical protein